MPVKERTLGLLKPDIYEKRNDIEKVIVEAGFTIVEVGNNEPRCRVLHSMELQLNESQAGEFYAEHVQKPFFADILAYITSGPVVAMVLEAEDGIAKWRRTIGPTSVVEAKATQSESLRAQFGTSDFKNGFHGSADEFAAERELALFFPKLALQPSVTGRAAKAYLADSVNPVLLKGLTELCKAKPSHPVVWLADWLLINNPKVVVRMTEEKEDDALNDDLTT